MKAALIVVCLWAATVHGQLLDIGDGKRIIVTKKGAYVPNAWIDLATDSVGPWRKGEKNFRVAFMQAVSISKENGALTTQNDSLRNINKRTKRLLLDCDSLYAEVDLNLSKCDDKLKRHRIRDPIFLLIALVGGYALSKL